MKIISIQRGYRIEAIDGPTLPITDEVIHKMMDPLDLNRSKIIIGAQSVEELLEFIISNHFFPPKIKNEKKTDFESQILTSEWCSFAAKLRLVLFIVESKGLLEKTQKNEFEKLVRKAMEYRNAFAHGTFSTDGRKVKISYFKAKPVSKIIDDDWLTEIENNLSNCITQCHNISAMISTPIELPDC